MELFNRCLGAPYEIDLRLLHQVTEGHPHRPGAGWTWMEDGEVQGFVLTRTGPKGIHVDALGVVPERRRRGIGRRLLAQSQATIVGGGPAHLFPGLPHEFLDAQEFFEKHGFVAGGEAIDLWMPAERALAPQEPGRLEYRPCSRGQEQELLDFVEREFPGRWSHDTRWRQQQEGLGEVIVGIRGQRICAFCHTWRPHHKMLGPSVFWRGELREPGGIGPVGVAVEARGGGAGAQLVMAALHHLRSHGAQDLTVDWTTLEGFYGRAGFETWRRYRTLTRPVVPR